MKLYLALIKEYGGYAKIVVMYGELVLEIDTKEIVDVLNVNIQKTNQDLADSFLKISIHNIEIFLFNILNLSLKYSGTHSGLGIISTNLNLLRKAISTLAIERSEVFIVPMIYKFLGTVNVS